MKIIAIGDIHGRDIWKKIVDKEYDADVIVFLGDYWDSFDIPYDKQYSNFKDIINYKEDSLDKKVVLLIGNHDYHYFPYDVSESYSGFQREHYDNIRQAIKYSLRNGLIKFAHQEEQFLFTHAGVTAEWYRNNYDITLSEGELDTEINSIPNSAFKFTPSTPLDNYGDSITQSPIWVRPRALLSDRVEGFIQVVGHTHQKNIVINDDVIFIDVFDNVNEYLTINDGVPSIGTI